MRTSSDGNSRDDRFDGAPAIRICSRHDDGKIRNFLTKFRSRVEENARETIDFAEPAARQQCEQWRFVGDAEFTTRGGLIRFHCELLCQWMADELRIDIVLRVDRRFHREQAQHAIRAGADLVCAFLAPRPDRRAHVMDRAHAGLFEFAFDAQIEIGCIDADERGGFFGERSLDHVALHAEQRRQMLDDFDEAHHAQFLARLPRPHAGGDHLRTSHAGEARIRKTRAQCLDQIRAEQIA